MMMQLKSVKLPDELYKVVETCSMCMHSRVRKYTLLLSYYNGTKMYQLVKIRQTDDQN